MGRHWYTARAYASAVERIAAPLSVFGLGADVIAGFPGESEDDHAETIALVAALPFTYLHVFPYSMRPGTAAERLEGHVAGEIVQRRARDLRQAGESKARDYRRRRAGTIADLIVVRRDIREGVTEDYLSVPIADPHLPRGTRLAVRLEGSEESLVAHPLAPVSVA
jgi:threonylcarbamoyladenosine tRNA methylthiotransferase MtaB